MLRFILQGAGWEIGRTAAREGIDALKDAGDASEPSDTSATVVDAGVARRRERQRRLIAKRQAAELEQQLRELKKRAGRR